MTEDPYNADCIKITDGSQFEWAVVGSLSEQYLRPVEFIERGFLACRLAHVSEDYFITRYLKGDRSVPFNKEVDEIYRDMLLQERWKN